MPWSYAKAHGGIKRKGVKLEELIMATALPEACDNLATEALVFMIGGCNRSLETSNWLLLVK